MNAAALTASETVIDIPLDRLDESPSNPRKHLGDLSEMVASIKQVGVLQPIVARAVGQRFEVVFGHKRRAAALKAEVATVPGILREYTDDEVLECQIIENNQRSDVHPLDEADGFAALIKRGYTVQQLADKIGRPVPYVAQRLKLCELGTECRKALDDSKISIGVALLLAKLPTAKLQQEALGQVVEIGDSQVSVAEARRQIETHVMCALKDAPFDCTSADLVPAAGACTPCPKRTGVQVDLFADASSPDLCTDPKCFRSKVDALWQIRAKEHRSAGGEVLNQKDAKTLFGYQWDAAARGMRDRYRKLDDSEYVGSRSKTVRQLFAKTELPPITLARDPESGAIVEFISRKEADAALRKAKGDQAKAASGKVELTAAQKRERELDRAREEAGKRLVVSVADAVANRTVWHSVEIDLLRGLALCLLARNWAPFNVLAKRRGWFEQPSDEPPAKGKAKRRSVVSPDEVLEERILAATAPELASIIVESIATEELGERNGILEPGAELICKALRLSFQSELAAVQKERAAKTAPPKPKDKPKKGARPAPKSSPSDDKPKPKAKKKSRKAGK